MLAHSFTTLLALFSAVSLYPTASAASIGQRSLSRGHNDAISARYTHNQLRRRLESGSGEITNVSKRTSKDRSKRRVRKRKACAASGTTTETSASSSVYTSSSSVYTSSPATTAYSSSAATTSAASSNTLVAQNEGVILSSSETDSAVASASSSASDPSTSAVYTSAAYTSAAYTSAAYTSDTYTSDAYTPTAATSTYVSASATSTSVAATSTSTSTSTWTSDDPDGNGPFSGETTYYVLGTDGSAIGACGTSLVDSDLIAAASYKLFEDWPGATADINDNPICGQYAKVTYNGNSVVVRIADECPSCDTRHLDLSEAAFSQLASYDVGEMDVTWEWVETSSG